MREEEPGKAKGCFGRRRVLLVGAALFFALAFVIRGHLLAGLLFILPSSAEGISLRLSSIVDPAASGEAALRLLDRLESRPPLQEGESRDDAEVLYDQRFCELVRSVCFAIPRHKEVWPSDSWIKGLDASKARRLMKELRGGYNYEFFGHPNWASLVCRMASQGLEVTEDYRDIEPCYFEAFRTHYNHSGIFERRALWPIFMRLVERISEIKIPVLVPLIGATWEALGDDPPPSELIQKLKQELAATSELDGRERRLMISHWLLALDPRPVADLWTEIVESDYFFYSMTSDEEIPERSEPSIRQRFYPLLPNSVWTGTDLRFVAALTSFEKRRLDNSSWRNDVVSIPVDAPEQLLKFASSSVALERRQAWLALGGMNVDWSDVRGALLEAVTDLDAGVRRAAFYALTKIVGPRADYIQLALRALADSDREVRRQGLRLAAITRLKDPSLLAAVLRVLKEAIEAAPDRTLAVEAAWAVLANHPEDLPTAILEFLASADFPINDPLTKQILNAWRKVNSRSGVAVRRAVAEHLRQQKPKEISDLVLRMGAIEPRIADAAWPLIRQEVFETLDAIASQLSRDDENSSRIETLLHCCGGLREIPRAELESLRSSVARAFGMDDGPGFRFYLAQATEDEAEKICPSLNVRRSWWLFELRSVRSKTIQKRIVELAARNWTQTFDLSAVDVADELAMSEDWALEFGLIFNRARVLESIDPAVIEAKLPFIDTRLKFAAAPYSKTPIAVLDECLASHPSSLVQFYLEPLQPEMDSLEPAFFRPELKIQKSANRVWTHSQDWTSRLRQSLTSDKELRIYATDEPTDSCWQAYCCALLGTFPESRELVWRQVLRALKRFQEDVEPWHMWMDVAASLRRFGPLPAALVDAIVRSPSPPHFLLCRDARRRGEGLQRASPGLWSLIGCPLTEDQRKDIAAWPDYGGVVRKLVTLYDWTEARRVGRPKEFCDGILRPLDPDDKTNLENYLTSEELLRSFPSKDDAERYLSNNPRLRVAELSYLLATRALSKTLGLQVRALKSDLAYTNYFSSGLESVEEQMEDFDFVGREFWRHRFRRRTEIH
jgi:alkylhydroperoxidase family enzyme